MKNMYEKLKDYFEKTPREVVEKEWDAVKDYDEVDSPHPEDFMKEQVLRANKCKFLWLDDVRNPFLPNTLYINQHPHLKTAHEYNKSNQIEIIWVRNFNEFKMWIYHNGLPDIISFDHDLADEHYTPSEYWDDYEKSKKYQESQNYQEKTGMDCAKWLVRYCMEYNKKLPTWFCHSANPVGKDNIESYLKQAKEKI